MEKTLPNFAGLFGRSENPKQLLLTKIGYFESAKQTLRVQLGGSVSYAGSSTTSSRKVTSGGPMTPPRLVASRNSCDWNIC